MFLIITLKYWNSTAVLKTLKTLEKILMGNYIYQDYIFIIVYWSVAWKLLQTLKRKKNNMKGTPLL